MYHGMGRDGWHAAPVRRYVKRGRRVLHELGAWPWTHAQAGHPQAGWSRDEAFLGPLDAWHENAWLSIVERLSDNARTFAQADQPGRWERRSWLRAREDYRRLRGDPLMNGH